MSTYTLREVGEALARLRAAPPYCMTQLALAKKVQVSESTVRRLEKGGRRHVTRPDLIGKICQAIPELKRYWLE
jgi:DNA-binding XRE family transcriptional regulator